MIKQSEFEFGNRPGELDLFGENPPPPAPFDLGEVPDESES